LSGLPKEGNPSTARLTYEDSKDAFKRTRRDPVRLVKRGMKDSHLRERKEEAAIPPAPKEEERWGKNEQMDHVPQEKGSPVTISNLEKRCGRRTQEYIAESIGGTVLTSLT